MVEAATRSLRHSRIVQHLKIFSGGVTEGEVQAASMPPNTAYRFVPIPQHAASRLRQHTICNARRVSGRNPPGHTPTGLTQPSTVAVRFPPPAWEREQQGVSLRTARRRAAADDARMGKAGVGPPHMGSSPAWRATAARLTTRKRCPRSAPPGHQAVEGFTCRLLLSIA
jgi:hypothetical protein